MIVRAVLLLIAVAAFVGVWTGDLPRRPVYGRSAGTALGGPAAIQFSGRIAPRTATGIEAAPKPIRSAGSGRDRSQRVHGLGSYKKKLAKLPPGTPGTPPAKQPLVMSGRQQTYAAHAYTLRCVPERACGRKSGGLIELPPSSPRAAARLASLKAAKNAPQAADAPILPADAEPDGFRLVAKLSARVVRDQSFIALSAPPLPSIATSPKRGPIRVAPSLLKSPKRGIASDAAPKRVYR